MVFVKEFSLESMLEIFGNSRSHIPWQFAISHIFFHLFDLKNLIIKNHDKYLQKKAALITNAQMGFGYRQFGKKNDASKKIWRRFGLKSRKSWQVIKLTQKSAFFYDHKTFFLSSKMCIHKVFNIKCLVFNAVISTVQSWFSDNLWFSDYSTKTVFQFTT